MNIQNLMAQAQKVQKELQKKQEEFYKKEFAFDYGNGAIVILILGSSEIKKIKIKKELIDPNDPITLQEMIAEAINSAYQQIKEKLDKLNESVVPNSNLGGLF